MINAANGCAMSPKRYAVWQLMPKNAIPERVSSAMPAFSLPEAQQFVFMIALPPAAITLYCQLPPPSYTAEAAVAG